MAQYGRTEDISPHLLKLSSNYSRVSKFVLSVNNRVDDLVSTQFSAGIERHRHNTHARNKTLTRSHMCRP